jgi:hypothetical protein
MNTNQRGQLGQHEEPTFECTWQVQPTEDHGQSTVSVTTNIHNARTRLQAELAEGEQSPWRGCG